MDEPTKVSFLDVSEVPGVTIAEQAADNPDYAEMMFELFGRDLETRTILSSPALSVYHETAQPGEQVKPHRHGTTQVDYVLRGELIFGNKHVTAGMAAVIPNTLYAWRAGDEGAEWLEIHGGATPGIYTDRPDRTEQG